MKIASCEQFFHMAHLFCFNCLSKFLGRFLTFIKGGKSASPKQILAGNQILQNLIFYYPYEPFNFYSAGLLKIAPIVTPLIQVND